MLCADVPEKVNSPFHVQKDGSVLQISRMIAGDNAD